MAGMQPFASGHTKTTETSVTAQGFFRKKVTNFLSVITPFAFFIITASCLHPFLPSLKPSGSPR